MTLATIRFLQRLVGEHVHIGVFAAVLEELDREESQEILRLAGVEPAPLPEEA